MRKNQKFVNELVSSSANNIPMNNLIYLLLNTDWWFASYIYVQIILK